MVGQESAEALALLALAYVVGDEALLAQFMALTGADPGAMRRGTRDPQFLAALADFMLAEDDRVLGFAEATGTAPDALVRARAALPGGDLPHWT